MPMPGAAGWQNLQWEKERAAAAAARARTSSPAPMLHIGGTFVQFEQPPQQQPALWPSHYGSQTHTRAKTLPRSQTRATTPPRSPAMQRVGGRG